MGAMGYGANNQNQVGTRRERWQAPVCLLAVVTSTQPTHPVAPIRHIVADTKSWLFVTTAKSGNLLSLGNGLVQMELLGTDAASLAFTDRPSRNATLVSTEALLSSSQVWTSSTGGAPNVAATFQLNGTSFSGVFEVLDVSSSFASAGVYVVNGTLLDPSGNVEELLDQQESMEGVLVDSVSLFIDDLSSTPPPPIIAYYPPGPCGTPPANTNWGTGCPGGIFSAADYSVGSKTTEVSCPLYAPSSPDSLGSSTGGYYTSTIPNNGAPGNLPQPGFGTCTNGYAPWYNTLSPNYYYLGLCNCCGSDVSVCVVEAATKSGSAVQYCCINQ